MGSLLNLARRAPKRSEGVWEEPSIPRTVYPSVFAFLRPQAVGVIVAFSPDREMVNYAQRELSIAASKDPLSPSVYPVNLRESPWAPADSDRRAARSIWLGYPNQAKRSSARRKCQFKLSPGTVYSPRWVQIYVKHGQSVGVDPQISHFLTLHLSITESDGAGAKM